MGVLITAAAGYFKFQIWCMKFVSGLSTNHRRFIRLPSCLEITIVAIVAGHRLQSMPRKQYGVYSRRTPARARVILFARYPEPGGIALFAFKAVIKYFSRDGSPRLRVAYAPGRQTCVWALQEMLSDPFNNDFLIKGEKCDSNRLDIIRD